LRGRDQGSGVKGRARLHLAISMDFADGCVREADVPSKDA
jgi:hypothetical protein